MGEGEGSESEAGRGSGLGGSDSVRPGFFALEGGMGWRGHMADAIFGRNAGGHWHHLQVKDLLGWAPRLPYGLMHGCFIKRGVPCD
jgi:hypothetical protein